MPIRVFIADDHQSLIDSLVKFFTNSEEFKYVGSAQTMEELWPRLKQKSDLIDVLVLDVLSPKKVFLGEVKRLFKIYPELPIVILSGHEDLNFARQLMDNGARAYVSKILGIEDISNSIKEVYRIPNMPLMKLPNLQAADSDREKVANLLTPRELQVISLLCKGFRNNDEIASFLSSINRQKIVNTTVQTHRKNIKKKLRDFEVLNDTSLGYWMAKWDLLDGSELSSTKE